MANVPTPKTNAALAKASNDGLIVPAVVAICSIELERRVIVLEEALRWIAEYCQRPQAHVLRNWSPEADGVLGVIEHEAKRLLDNREG